MNINQKIELEIIDMTDEGSSLAKIDGITVFLDRGVIGDKVIAKITKIKKNYLQAKVSKIVKKSFIRTDEKICDIQDICGGCQIMDIKYEKQLEIKKNIVLQKLQRIGQIENPKVNDVVGMYEPLRYRNKVQMPVGMIDNKMHIGFYRQKTHDIVPFTDCMIQDEINNEIVEAIKEFVSEKNISIYDESTHKGNLRHIVTKISKIKTEIMLILVTNSEQKLNVDYLVSKIKEKNIPISSIVQNINTKKTNVILSSQNVLLYGKEYIEDCIKDLVFRIYPNSFYQVNYIQMIKMYEKALEYSQINDTDIVYDLYCGIGTISLLLAQRAKQVYAIEVVSEAIKSANENAQINNIENVEFICGKVENEIENLVQKSKLPDVVVLDPARKGCEKIVLDTILSAQPKKIVYISCNSSTLARDLQILLSTGEYTLEEVTPYDLFCHTMHVENVAVLSHTK